MVDLIILNCTYYHIPTTFIMFYFIFINKLGLSFRQKVCQIVKSMLNDIPQRPKRIFKSDNLKFFLNNIILHSIFNDRYLII